MTTNIKVNLDWSNIWILTYYICYLTNKTKWNTNSCNCENSDSKCNENTIRRGNQLAIDVVFQIKYLQPANSCRKLQCKITLNILRLL